LIIPPFFSHYCTSTTTTAASSYSSGISKEINMQRDFFLETFKLVCLPAISDAIAINLDIGSPLTALIPYY
jgi:hypothetical protein